MRRLGALCTISAATRSVMHHAATRSIMHHAATRSIVNRAKTISINHHAVTRAIIPPCTILLFNVTRSCWHAYLFYQ